MNRPADSFSFSVNAQSTRPNDAGLQAAHARQLHREKTDFICLEGRARKSFNHSNPVTAITDSYSFTLLMCSYSPSSMSECAAGSTSGETRVDSSRPQLSWKTNQSKNSSGCAIAADSNKPHRGQATSFFGSIQCSNNNVLIQS